MTPVRAAAMIRGDVPGLLRRGMPVRDDNGDRDVYSATQDDAPELWTIDYTAPAALYLSLHWLADRGHPMLWALPTTHGGRVEAWDGLAAWEVSAILVSYDVAMRTAGKAGITGIAHAYGIPTNARMSMDRIGRADVYWTATEADRDYFVAPCSLGHDSRATPDHPGWLYTPRLGFTSHGPEVGAEAVVKINECALADGCCLQVPGGLVVPV